jgi:hypothetical protein
LRARKSARRWTGAARAAIAAAVSASLLATPARADRVRISDLSDVNFGTIDPSVDAHLSQDVCIFSDDFQHEYSVTAYGMGFGFGFIMVGRPGFVPLDYEVEWNDHPGRDNGTRLFPGNDARGFETNGGDQSCGGGVFENASLIIVLRSSALSRCVNDAVYSGVLVLTIAPD